MVSDNQVSHHYYKKNGTHPLVDNAVFSSSIRCLLLGGRTRLIDVVEIPLSTTPQSNGVIIGAGGDHEGILGVP